MKRHHKGRRQSALTWLIISSFVTIISSSSSSSFSIEGVKEWPLILVYKLLFLSVSALLVLIIFYVLKLPELLL